MKVLIKNNRLVLESRLENLASASEAKLKELARKWQIGLQTLAKTSVERNKDGKVVEEESYLYQLKSRAILEDEIRKRLKITLDIPKDYWTEAQEYAWTSADAEQIREITEERKVKEEAGIYTELKPFETGLDNFSTLKLLVELTEDQWDHFKGVFNFYDKETGEKDETGRLIRERTYIHRLMPHEYVPENDEDIERLREMSKGREKTKAVMESLKKYDKIKTK